MKCVSCGSPLHEAAAFCEDCGAAVAGLHEVPEPPPLGKPDGWTEHRDPWYGMRLFIPGGWRTLPYLDHLVVAQAPDSTARAFAMALGHAPDEIVSPEAVVGRWQKASRGLLTVTTFPQTAEGRRSTWSFDGALLGVSVRGELEVEMRGRAAVLRGLCVPAEDPVQMDALRAILASFAPVSHVRRVSIIEPNALGALQIPQGWSADDGTPVFTVRDPRTGCSIRFGLDGQRFIKPSLGATVQDWVLKMLTPKHERAHFKPEAQMEPMPAIKFLERHTLERWREQHPHLKLLGLEDRPDLSALSREENRWWESSVAEALVTWPEDGDEHVERVCVGCSRMGDLYGASVLYAIGAQRAQWDGTDTIARGVAASVRAVPRPPETGITFTGGHSFSTGPCTSNDPDVALQLTMEWLKATWHENDFHPWADDWLAETVRS